MKPLRANEPRQGITVGFVFIPSLYRKLVKKPPHCGGFTVPIYSTPFVDKTPLLPSFRTATANACPSALNNASILWWVFLP